MVPINKDRQAPSEAEGPLISCIVPVYNGELYLREALDSIFSQGYEPLEVIVVDDGSTDGTAKVVDRYDGRIRYVRQSNAGPVAARNRGLEEAKGDFIAFLDADDLWHPNKIRVQISRFQAQPGLEYCLAHVQNFWIPELRDEANRLRNHRIAQPLPGYVAGTLLAKHSLFDRIGPLNIALSHGDAGEWCLRADGQGAVKEVLPDVLLFRRLHHTNRSRLLASQSRNQHLQILKAHLDRTRGLKT